MCTVSWRRDGGVAATGYRLWFNRDERHTRAAEHAPVERISDLGVRYLCPLDGERGGTWLAANERGVTVALLNDYTTPWAMEGKGAASDRPSRGALVRGLAGARDLSELRETLREVGLDRLPPFHLLGLTGAGMAGWHWDGRTLSELVGEALAPPWSSSSFCAAEVIGGRREQFVVDGVRTDDEHLAYHESHDASRGAQSVNMSRPDAATRSICVVIVSAGEVTLEYRPQAWPGAPRSASGPVTLRLARGERVF